LVLRRSKFGSGEKGKKIVEREREREIFVVFITNNREVFDHQRACCALE
jgi:hypothetical protein